MSHYTQLLREHKRDRRQQQSGGDGRKRRRKQTDVAEPSGSSNDPIDVEETRNESLEDDLGLDSESDSDEFEDIDIGNNSPNGTDDEEEPQYTFEPEIETERDAEPETLTIQVHQPEVTESRKKVEFISKQERKLRLLVHQWYIVTMLAHASIRNRWCNNSFLLEKLRKTISPDIVQELESIRSNKRKSLVNAVRFTDIIRQLMHSYSQTFKITRQGIVRKTWNELNIPQTNIERNVRLDKFQQLILQFQGSRDIGSQGFVSLLRSLGMKVRLVFSLQPPDFTMVTKMPDKITKEEKEETKEDSKGVEPVAEEAAPKPKPKFVNSKHRFLHQKPVKPMYTFPSSSYPIYWIEVWNKYNQKWLSVDPMVLKIVEQPPMRRKSSFEPPWSDPTNNLVYVIAFDSAGGVKDVTRRYAQQYNSKTVKKRIGSKSEEFGIWYSRVINGFNSRTTPSRVDILELKEFRDRDLAEGMPNSVSGFKDHPIYALDSQLRQNQIIYPKDETTKVGTFRYKTTKKNKDLVPVYKRSAVHYLRSAKAWYLRGRVLKIGVQPLRIKAVKRKTTFDDFDDDEDDEESTRLYAEFQTKLYIPPPIENDKIPKNAYGNIDIYVPTMIPDGGCLIEEPVKLAEQAGKILEIDFAKAIIGFDFKSSKRTPNVREGGVVVSEDHKEAMQLMIEQLKQHQEAQLRKQAELKTLQIWKVFLTRLRIAKRLNKQHGAIDSDTTNDKPEIDKEWDSSEVSDESEYEPGGFVPGEFVPDESAAEVSQSETSDVEPDNPSDMSDEGGFVVEVDPVERLAPDNGAHSAKFVPGYEIEETQSVESGSDDDLGDSAGGGMEDPVEVSSNDSRDDFSDELANDANKDSGIIAQIGNSQAELDKSANVSATQSATNTPLRYEDVPDEDFRYDANGELVYDPDNYDFEYSDDD